MGDTFCRNLFDGSALWDEFYVEYTENVRGKSEKGYQFMEGTWVRVPEGGLPNGNMFLLPEEYVNLAMPTRDDFENDIAGYHEAARHAESHNEKVEVIFQTCRQELSKRISKELLKDLNKVRHREGVYVFWNMLKDKYGNVSRGIIHIVDKAIERIMSPMTTEQNFTTWLTKKAQWWDTHEVNIEERIGWLVQYKELPSKQQLLPDRLVPAIKEARLRIAGDDKQIIYNTIVETIRLQDNIYHGNQAAKTDSKAVNAVSKKDAKKGDKKQPEAKNNQQNNKKGQNQNNKGHNNHNDANNSNKRGKHQQSNDQSRAVTPFKHGKNQVPKAICPICNNPFDKPYAVLLYCMNCVPTLYSNETDNANSSINTRSHRGKPVRSVAAIADEYDRDIEEVEENEQRRYVRSVTRGNIRTVNSSSILPMVVDSGAQEHCCSDKYIHLLNNVVKYDNVQCPVTLIGAGSVPLTILGSGYFKNFQDIIYIIQDLETNLFSTMKANLNIIQFPNNYTESIDSTIAFGLLVDNQGSARFVIEKNLEIDMAKFGNSAYDNISYLECLHKAHTYKHISAVINIPHLEKDLAIQDKVDFMTKTLLFRKEDMLSACTNVKNFPLTEFQVNKYYRVIQEIRAGSQKMSSIHKKSSKTPPTSDNTTSTTISDKNTSAKLENLIIGEEVATDQVGSYCNKVEMPFVDKASGYVMSFSTNLKKLNDKSMPKLATYTKEFVKAVDGCYRKNGHYIVKLKGDNHTIYKSQAVKLLCKQLEIDLELSPPGEHRLNGLAEITVFLIKSRVKSMFQLAPYIPPQFWTYLWSAAVYQLNLKPSRIDGHENMTRIQDFSGKQPDFLTMGMLPAGIPISVTNPPLMRRGVWAPNAHMTMYLCPDFETPGAIKVYDPVTNQVYTTASYKVLTYQDVPSSWKHLNHLHDTIFDDELPEVIRNPIITPPNHPRNFINKDLEGDDDEVNISTTAINKNLEGGKKKAYSDNARINLEGAKVQTEPSSSLKGDKLSTSTVVSNQTPTVPPTINTQPPTVNLPTDSSKLTTRLPRQSPTKKSAAATKPALGKSTSTPTPTPVPKTTTLPSSPQRPKRSTTDWQKGPVKFRETQRVNNKKVQRTISQRQVYKIIKKNRSFDNPTMDQAKKREDWPKWEKAIQDEYAQLVAEDVYTIIEKPTWIDDTSDSEKKKKQKNVIGSMFVLQIKRDKVTGEIDKYKARLVALGNQQKPGSYTEISSNTIRSNTVKLLLSIQAQTDSSAMVIDIKGAYLKSKIDLSKDENLVLRLPNLQYALLNKYLYGLKQSGLEWQRNITGFLKSQEFRVTSDPLLFQKRIKNSNDFIIVSIHVDDLYIISTCDQHLHNFYLKIKNHYHDITVKQGDNLQYLGVAISHDKSTSTVSVSQPAYVEKILEECGFDVTKGASTPMTPSYLNTFDDNYDSVNDTANDVEQLYYMKLVGMLNYLAIYSRPDILFALSRVSQRSQKPTVKDLLAVKRIFRYIYSTKNKTLNFTKQKIFRVICQVDASYNCYTDGKSHYGYSFTLGHFNAPFCVKSSKIKIQALSSTEAEYIALANAVREALYVIRLLKDLGFYDNKRPLLVYEDNKPVIDMLKSDKLVFHSTKHINPRFHFVKDLYKNGIINIDKIDTDNNLADMLTKPLTVIKFSRFANQLLNYEA